METQRWKAVLSRIGPHGADDLDGVVGAHDVPRDPGREIFPTIAAVPPPQTALKRPDTVCVGIRVAAHLTNAADQALRLIAFAAERSVEIVVLAETDTTGLERFGFRIERIVGDDAEARARCEAQVRRFWNIDLVL